LVIVEQLEVGHKGTQHGGGKELPYETQVTEAHHNPIGLVGKLKVPMKQGKLLDVVQKSLVRQHIVLQLQIVRALGSGIGH